MAMALTRTASAASNFVAQEASVMTAAASRTRRENLAAIMTFPEMAYSAGPP